MARRVSRQQLKLVHPRSERVSWLLASGVGNYNAHEVHLVFFSSYIQDVDFIPIEWVIRIACGGRDLNLGTEAAV